MKRRWSNGGLAGGFLIGACWLGICGLHGAPPQETDGRTAVKQREAKNPFEEKLVEVSLSTEQPSTEQPSTPDGDGLWEQVRFEVLHGRTFLVGRVVGTAVERYVAWDSVHDFCVFDSREQYDEFLRGRLGRALDRVSTVLGDSHAKSEICTIRVSPIDLGDGRAAIGESLTEAVVKEIENVTPLRVSQAPDAESALSCRIEYDAQHSRAVVPRAKAAASLVIRWTDRNGDELRPAFSVPLPTFGPSSDAPFREVGQSLTPADQRSIESLARQIVEKLQPAW